MRRVDCHFEMGYAIAMSGLGFATNGFGWGIYGTWAAQPAVQAFLSTRLFASSLPFLFFFGHSEWLEMQYQRFSVLR